MSGLFDRLFGIKPKNTAQTAKERLLLVVAHERDERHGKQIDLPALQKELLAVISRYVAIQPEDIKVNLDRQNDYEMLKVDIVLPEAARPNLAR
ncbi:MAG: cell division topological specificity factor MinE [Zoogloeaceae bacterium]|jgi:cell division topological specificity factor|nr:cell division topological specificity factor MinE [Zoogloeaceae bacterium]